MIVVECAALPVDFSSGSSPAIVAGLNRPGARAGYGMVGPKSEDRRRVVAAIGSGHTKEPATRSGHSEKLQDSTARL